MERRYNWNTPGNWSLGHVPLAGEDVVLSRTLPTMTLNIASTPNLNSVTVSGNGTTTFAIGANTLNVTGAGASAISTTAGSITIAGGTINDSGGLALGSGTSLSGRGTLNITGASAAPGR